MRHPESPHCVLFIMLAALVPLYHTACRDGAVSATKQCWAQYDALLYAQTETNTFFYSGIDPEQMRQFCDELGQSMTCTRHVAGSCSAAQGDVISYVSPYAGFGDLCIDQEFNELYARTQNCFISLKPSGEMCKVAFEQSTTPIMPRARESDPEALAQYCSAVQVFIECLETRVRINCISEALPLAGKLVTASLPLSSVCTQEPEVSDKHEPNGGGTSDRSQQDRDKNNSSSSIHNGGVTLTLALTLLLSVTLHRH